VRQGQLKAPATRDKPNNYILGYLGFSFLQQEKNPIAAVLYALATNKLLLNLNLAF
jgi:hypothetical protein